MGEELNKMYKDLINRTTSMKSSFGIGLFGNKTKLRIQNTLLEIFTETTRPIKGKNSLLRKHMLGKTIDYSASNVITAPEVSKANRPEDMPVNFGYASFPIGTVVSLFIPFYINRITAILSGLLRYAEVANANDISKINKNQFNNKYAEKLIKLFVKSETERFKPIKYSYTNLDGEIIEKDFSVFEYRIPFKGIKPNLENEKYIKRAMTLTDLFYIVTMEDIVTDKHIYMTRYPVINFQNITPVKIKLMSTSKTRSAYLKFFPEHERVTYYSEYPYVKFDEDPNPGKGPDYNFINVLIPGNIYINAMGGDYDGDMLYMRGLFTKEANQEAAKLIKSKGNFLGASGEPTRGINAIGKEASIALFELTKEGK
jgi:hypothetical protein